MDIPEGGGKEVDSPDQGLPHRIVMDLVDDHRKGYVVFTNTGPALFRNLAEKRFGACGTAQKGRRGIPISVRDTRLKKGEVFSFVKHIHLYNCLRIMGSPTVQ